LRLSDLNRNVSKEWMRYTMVLADRAEASHIQGINFYRFDAFLHMAPHVGPETPTTTLGLKAAIP